MVIFWGRPAAGRRFHRRGAHPPQPFTTNAAFRDLWNHAAVARRRDADTTAVTAALPGCYGVFFCLVTVRHFAGLSAAVPPLRRHVGRSLSLPPSCAPSQPCRRLHDCPSHAAVASQSSPPASLLIRWALIQQFFRGLLHFRDSRPSVLLESRAHPAAALCSHLMGELLGQLLAVIFPSPGSS